MCFCAYNYIMIKTERRDFIKNMESIRFPMHFVSRSHELNTLEKHIAAPLLRKSFELKTLPQNAELLICGLGLYRVFINGTECTKGLLAPYINNPDHFLYYDKYDVTQLLQEGKNVIGITLGNGMLNPDSARIWDMDKAPYKAAPMAAFSISENENIITDSSGGVKTADSACTFDDLRAGCFFDGRLFDPKWNTAELDDSSWDKAISVTPPKGKPILSKAEPIRVIAQNEAVSMRAGRLTENFKVRGDFRGDQGHSFAPERDGFIFDFGTNSAGIFTAEISGAAAGTQISFQPVEVLNEKGEAWHLNMYFLPDGYASRDIYICRGGVESFTPYFTYHGFRYLFVSGITEELAAKIKITKLVCSSNVENAGRFNCSDEMLNKIFALAQNSLRSNLYYFCTDCPTREKNGWMGDAAITCEAMFLCYGVENTYREWLRNISAAQNNEGVIPAMVPTAGWGFRWGNGPAWDRNLPFLADAIIRFTGNTEHLEEACDSLVKYIKYIITRRNEDGLFKVGLGDWLQPYRNYPDYTSTPIDLTDTAVVRQICLMTEKLLLLADRKNEAEWVNGLAKSIEESFKKHFICENGYETTVKTQTAGAIALLNGFYAPEKREKAAQVLAEMIERDGKMDVGILGCRILFFALSEYGYEDLAYRLITGPEPSYARFVEDGLTALPETFDYRRRFPRVADTSFNHPTFGCVIEWFISGICGIRFGNNEVTVKPCFPTALDFAEAESRGVYSAWKREGDRIILTVKNTTKRPLRVILNGVESKMTAAEQSFEITDK